ncbi:MAG: bacteriohemerythrin [Candidatus Sulfobium sp.]|jgi:hemerythrin
MKWTEDLSVGIEEIDEQHKELISRINDLVDSVRQKACKYKIGDVIKFLEEYIVVHFGEEEELMRKHDYPEYKSHKARHEYFMREFAELRKELEKLEGGKKRGSYDLSVETNRIVVDWILDHIAKVDKRLGAHLKAKM